MPYVFPSPTIDPLAPAAARAPDGVAARSARRLFASVSVRLGFGTYEKDGGDPASYGERQAYRLPAALRQVELLARRLRPRRLATE